MRHGVRAPRSPPLALRPSPPRRPRPPRILRRRTPILPKGSPQIGRNRALPRFGSIVSDNCGSTVLRFKAGGAVVLIERHPVDVAGVVGEAVDAEALDRAVVDFVQRRVSGVVRLFVGIVARGVVAADQRPRDTAPTVRRSGVCSSWIPVGKVAWDVLQCTFQEEDSAATLRGGCRFPGGSRSKPGRACPQLNASTSCLTYCSSRGRPPKANGDT